MSETFEWLLGIDWGSEAHELCLLDARDRSAGRGRSRIPRRRCTKRCSGSASRPAPPRGDRHRDRDAARRVGRYLHRAGFCVFALNPKQLDRFRDRFTAAGAKDDQRDAHVLADALRTDRRAFRRVRPDDPLIIQLREVTRLREDLQEEERRLANRVREQLYRVDAAWLTLSPAADEPWLWALLAEAPDPGGLGAAPAPAHRGRAARPPHSTRSPPTRSCRRCGSRG